MESVIDEEEEGITTHGSDSDVSVTVDEHGTLTAAAMYLSPPLLHVSTVSQTRPQTTAQVSSPSPLAMSTTVGEGGSRGKSRSASPTRPMSSSDDSKHKSFASKLTAFLQRKPSEKGLISPVGPSTAVHEIVDLAAAEQEGQEEMDVIDTGMKAAGSKGSIRYDEIMVDSLDIIPQQQQNINVSERDSEMMP
jgi:hypothetical protein